MAIAVQNPRTKTRFHGHIVMTSPESPYGRPELDPLGNDWKARSERGTAMIREQSYLERRGAFVDMGRLRQILVDLSTDAIGILSGIPDALAAAGANEQIVQAASQKVHDAMSVMSRGLDRAADAASSALSVVEAEIMARDPGEATAPTEANGAAKIRKKGGGANPGNAKPKRPR